MRGVRRLKSLKYRYIGNLDADIPFDSGYFAELLKRFEEKTQLGLAGGAMTEEVVDRSDSGGIIARIPSPTLFNCSAAMLRGNRRLSPT